MSVIYTTTVGSIDFGFDWEDQEIEIDSTTVELSAVDLKTAIKMAEGSEIGIVFPGVADFGNPVTLTAAASTFLTVILRDQWRILSMRTSGTFTTGEGNVVNVNNGIDIFAENPQVSGINNISSAGVLVETGVSGLTSSEAANLLLIKQILANYSEITEGASVNTVELYDSDDSSGSVVATWEVSDDDKIRTRTS